MIILENISACWETTADVGEEETEGILTVSNGPPFGLENPKYDPHRTDLVIIDVERNRTKELIGSRAYWDNQHWTITHASKENDGIRRIWIAKMTEPGDIVKLLRCSSCCKLKIFAEKNNHPWCGACMCDEFDWASAIRNLTRKEAEVILKNDK